MAGELRLQNEERDSEQYQKHTGEIHRQQLHGIQSEQRADSANHAGSDYSGMSKFGVQAENANDQQDEEYVGLNDSGEEFLPPGQFKLRQGVVVQGQLCRFSVEARDFAAVQGMQEFVSVGHDHIDQVGVQRLFCGECPRLSDGGLRKFGIAAAFFGETTQEGSGIVVQFAAENFVHGHIEH